MTSLDTVSGRDGSGSTARASYVSEPVTSLRRVLFGGEREFARHMRIRDELAALGDVPRSGVTQAQEALASYTLLPRAIEAMGGSARAIAADERASYALFDWSAAVAPRLWTLLSGHIKLSIAAVENRNYVRRWIEFAGWRNVFGTAPAAPAGRLSGPVSAAQGVIR